MIIISWCFEKFVELFFLPPKNRKIVKGLPNPQAKKHKTFRVWTFFLFGMAEGIPPKSPNFCRFLKGRLGGCHVSLLEDGLWV